MRGTNNRGSYLSIPINHLGLSLALLLCCCYVIRQPPEYILDKLLQRCLYQLDKDIIIEVLLLTHTAIKMGKRPLIVVLVMPVILFALLLASLAFVKTETTYAQVGGANINIPPTSSHNAFNENTNTTSLTPTTTTKANTARSPYYHDDNKSHHNLPKH